MDVQMPEMSGLEAIRVIRQGGDLPADIPIIALTAYVMDGDQERFLAAGFDEYLAKPLDLTELKAKLVKILSQEQSPSALPHSVGT
jgi:two-component system CheB/CheR fusion protein